MTEVDSHILYKDLGNRNLILLKPWKPTGFQHTALAIKRNEENFCCWLQFLSNDDTSHPLLQQFSTMKTSMDVLRLCGNSLVKPVCSSKSLCWKTAACLNGFILTDCWITTALLCKALKGIWDPWSITSAGINPSS